MSEILDFIKKAGVFYIATVSDGRPRLRPFGFAEEHDGRLYLATSNSKEVYKQLKANPALEINASGPDGSWVRVSGKAVFDYDRELRFKFFDLFPRFRDIYGAPDNPAFEIFYVGDIKAFIYERGSEPRQIGF